MTLSVARGCPQPVLNHDRPAAFHLPDVSKRMIARAMWLLCARFDGQPQAIRTH
jgi:hypothetical protein